MVLIVLALAPLACVKDKDPVKPEQQAQTPQVDESDVPNAVAAEDSLVDITVLGARIDNPYTMRNMERAVDSIAKWNSEADDVPAITQPLDLEATDLYVRFLPADTSQLERLYDDYDLELFDIPLDYEVVEGGTYYHDSTTGTAFTWLYSVVKPDFKFPSDIKSELIDSLFIPETQPRLC